MYKDLKDLDSFTSVQVPQTFLPIPSDIDYSTGKINRYFIQKTNDKTSPVFEINQDTYNELIENPFWTKVEINWRISGKLEPQFNDNGLLTDPGVRISNLNEISKNQKSISTLKRYLINPTQFYKPYRI